MGTNAAIDLFDLADQVGLFSSTILSYRIRNKSKLTDPEIIKLEDAEQELDKLTARLRAEGVQKLAELTDEARQEVLTATDKADKFLRRLKKVEKIIGVVTAILELGLAVISKKPVDIFKAAKALKGAAGKAT